MSISVIIPNYNGKNILEKNLPKIIESLEDYKGKKEVIVVDDFSSDESLEFLKNFKHENYKFFQNSKNLGFSSTVNNGVNHSNGEIILLLNTDVRPEKYFLDSLLKHFETDKNTFAVGCLDKSVEDNITVLRGRGLGKWYRGFLVHRRGEVDKTSTLWVSGGSGAFRKSIWEKLGGFNELYDPFYWEDIDLSYRALKSGYKIVFEPNSKVIHEHETGTIKTGFSKNYVKSISYRNQFIFVWCNATDLSLQFSHILWLPYHFLKAILRKDKEFFVGFFNAFKLLPKVIKLSFENQKSFVKKDSEVIKSL